MILEQSDELTTVVERVLPRYSWPLAGQNFLRPHVDGDEGTQDGAISRETATWYHTGPGWLPGQSSGCVFRGQF
eukprot:4141249-Amphidinium_carterae.1